MQNKDSESIIELAGAKLISLPHGIEFENKIKNQKIYFGTSDITELYFTESNLYKSSKKNISLVRVPRHNFTWRDTYQSVFSNFNEFSKNDIVIFSDPDRRFSRGEKLNFSTIFLSLQKI